MIDIAEKKHRIVETITLLSSDPDEQLAAFPSSVARPDEIALAFDDALLFIPELRAAGQLTDAEVARFEEIERHLDGMSGVGNDELWTEAAVRERPEWEVIRSRARDILAVLGVPRHKPDLSWMTFLG
jgi:hypothetical protein